MIKRIFQDPWDAALSLVTGLWITLRQMFSKPCTIQYPEQRLAWPPRTRGRLVMPRDAGTQKHKCTACLICQKICPNGSIEIAVRTSAANKKELGDYLHHLDRCSYCGLCVEACPFDALRMSHEHEIAVLDKTALKRHLQNEELYFEPQWQGGLPAKADQAQALKKETH